LTTGEISNDEKKKKEKEKEKLIVSRTQKGSVLGKKRDNRRDRRDELRIHDRRIEVDSPDVRRRRRPQNVIAFVLGLFRIVGQGRIGFIVTSLDRRISRKRIACRTECVHDESTDALGAERDAIDQESSEVRGGRSGEEGESDISAAGSVGTGIGNKRPVPLWRESNIGHVVHGSFVRIASSGSNRICGYCQKEETQSQNNGLHHFSPHLEISGFSVNRK